MTDSALSCRGLSKEYRIGQRESYKALRDVLTDTMYAPFRRIKAALRGQTPEATKRQTFWALDDVSFDVRAGDVVGIIGGNGAGKSTLLKILSRITEPTNGHAHVRGRVGSLLEVGTGFNPELTGRENTYLNGAILGMKKVDIDRRFEEIVAFAEVERFLDTPVKHYSSGMYMRLAFAVAAHLEPEVLLVDEVLAVGDAQFQKKCFAKMQEIGRGGRTILLVSHNMSAVRHICTRGIALEAGRLVDDGDINGVVDRYIASASTNQPQGAGMDTATFKVHETSIRSRSGPVIKTFDSVEIRVAFTPKFDVSPGCSVAILTSDNVRLIALQSKDFHPPQLVRAGTRTEIGLVIDGLPLLNGTYQMEVHIHDDVSFVNEAVPRSTYFDVVETPVYGGRKIDRWFGSIGVRVRPAADPVFDGDKNRPRILAAERELRSGPLVKEAKC